MKPFLGYLKEENMSLFTDYYELTMCAAYFDNKNFEVATFDLFIRRLPENRSYFLFAGLEEALGYLQSIKFTEEHLSLPKKAGFPSRFSKLPKRFQVYWRSVGDSRGHISFPQRAVDAHNRPHYRSATRRNLSTQLD